MPSSSDEDNTEGGDGRISYRSLDDDDCSSKD